jgi:hypothetical protein
MIDWFSVFSAALWISGLALALALFGFARMSQEQSTRQVLAQPHFRIGLMFALALFALGMSLSVGTWFERVGWGVVVVLSLWEAWSARRAQGAQ